MTIVGTRPEFVQIGPVTHAIRRDHVDILVNTGQHYDDNMSSVFFGDLGLPKPEVNLGVGSGSHAVQTAAIMTKLEPVVLSEKPDWVLVYGDTNSTLAAALIASKLTVPLAHIEAGLRSFDRRMPEEVNRVITDHVSQLLFAPTQIAVTNLAHEGIVQGVHQVGDVRVDIMRQFAGRASERIPVLRRQFNLAPEEPFALATIHRPSNTDDRARLQHIVETLNTLGIAVLLPAHPRLKKMLATFDLECGASIRLVDPLGFLDLIAMLQACEIVITDSGGLQKEAYLLHRPTVTVRDSTEWVETVESGWNRLCEPDPASFKAAVAEARSTRPAGHPDYYGSPGVSERILEALLGQ